MHSAIYSTHLSCTPIAFLTAVKLVAQNYLFAFLSFLPLTWHNCTDKKENHICEANTTALVWLDITNVLPCVAIPNNKTWIKLILWPLLGFLLKKYLSTQEAMYRNVLFVSKSVYTTSFISKWCDLFLVVCMFGYSFFFFIMKTANVKQACS